MRVVFLQYGDYGDAYGRLQTGGPETFRDQRHSVNYVASLAPKHDVTTIAVSNRQHDEQLAPGLRSIGLSYDLFWDQRRLWPLLDRLDPEAIVCRHPNRVALAWAAKNRVPTLPIFADMFSDKGLRNRLNNWRLGESFAVASNHASQTTASRRHSLSVASAEVGYGLINA